MRTPEFSRVCLVSLKHLRDVARATCVAMLPVHDAVALAPKRLSLFAVIFFAAAFVTFLLSFHQQRHQQQPDQQPQRNSSPQMAAASSRSRSLSFILWLHGLGDSGPANEPIKTFFSSPDFNTTTWAFPSAPSNPVSCNYGAIMPSWFDIYEMPITAESPKDEKGVLRAVQNVHAMIDKEVAAGTSPENIFVCGFSQGGALTLASVLLYPKTLGGGSIFSGWVPFNSSIIERISPEAKKTPFLWSHGIADRTVLFEAGQAGPPFLEQAGIKCEFKAYPELGHFISNEELQTLESWIKTHLKSCS